MNPHELLAFCIKKQSQLPKKILNYLEPKKIQNLNPHELLAFCIKKTIIITKKKNIKLFGTLRKRPSIG